MDPEIWIAAASFVVSSLAFWVAWRADLRGQVAARTQLFLDLRTRFLEVHSGLPAQYRDPNWDASDPAHRAAAVRYWHHAFDEWYTTRRLNERLMRRLWDDYYVNAVCAGLRYNGLRRTIIDITRPGIEVAPVWQEFRRELDRIWAREHPANRTACSGLDCAHTPTARAP
jgi:hypothetical protein